MMVILGKIWVYPKLYSGGTVSLLRLSYPIKNFISKMSLLHGGNVNNSINSRDIRLLIPEI
jgi:hypothetical protein